MHPNSTLVERLETIKKLVEKAAVISPLASAPPTVIAVSKTHAAEDILPLLEAGHRDFGENRVQEAMAKWPALKARFPDIKLHLIGPLQSNKAKDAVALFDMIHTLDRPKLAEALASEMTRAARRLPCLIEINTGEEPQKAGIAPRDMETFLKFCRSLPVLDIHGLMCIPPLEENPAPHFGLLHRLAQAHHLPELSMGMSSDFEIAAGFGATYVRVGSAIFGERNR